VRSNFKIISSGHSLAESPGINRFNGKLFWVDIDEDRFFEYSPESNQVFSRKMSKGITSVHALGASVYLATGRTSIYRFDSQNEDSSAEKALWESTGENDWRFNDSILCPSGALVVGTKDLSNASVKHARIGVFLDQKLSWLEIPFGLANGMSLDLERKRFYCSDSTAGSILVWELGSRDYPTAKDACSEFVGQILGEPDGMEIDAEGNIWVACWGAGKLTCFSPNGEELRTIEVGAELVSSLAFVRSGSYNCLVTTATSSEEVDVQSSTYPLRGGQVGLFEIEELRTSLNVKDS